MLPRVFTEQADDVSYEEYLQEKDIVKKTWMPSLEDLKLLTDSQLDDLREWSKLGYLEDHDTFMFLLKRANLAGREIGRRLGWWDEYDADGPIPPAKTVSMANYAGKTMAHVMADVGFFVSIGEARKNGWNKPVETGIFKVGKHKRVKIIE